MDLLLQGLHNTDTSILETDDLVTENLKQNS